MSDVVGVRFERAGKISYFTCGDLQLSFGDQVIVESSWGLDFGTVVTPCLSQATSRRAPLCAWPRRRMNKAMKI